MYSQNHEKSISLVFSFSLITSFTRGVDSLLDSSLVEFLNNFFLILKLDFTSLKVISGSLSLKLISSSLSLDKGIS